ncbi:mitochondrial coenzyme A diphosphatase NUDT8-like [Xenia sp. Carnegie-2017]|uniref:mitochondrial coenzyme A diphosphatase NUDT8-like n=1 Tax=Xenia sp. Carnegie-2017 TaxID=2897299 RepID=UPI001F03AA7A|nr:mitochondrial coenzyme A diphosphatase NUDT8-like [Xenia sp. Carnegie-2017]
MHILRCSGVQWGRLKFCRFMSSKSKRIIASDILQRRKYDFIKKIEKISEKQKLWKEEGTLAGVLVPFCVVDCKPSILLTKRSSKIIRNKSDVCFPGGKMDKGVDNTIIDTALRETNEEIGLSTCDVEVWLATKPIAASYDETISVVPVFGYIHNVDISTLTINKNEVESVFTVALEDLCDVAQQAHTKFKSGTVLPLFYQHPYKIWGFTAVIMDFCLANLLPDFYTLRFVSSRKQKQ